MPLLFNVSDNAQGVIRVYFRGKYLVCISIDFTFRTVCKIIMKIDMLTMAKCLQSGNPCQAKETNYDTFMLYAKDSRTFQYHTMRQGNVVKQKARHQ